MTTAAMITALKTARESKGLTQSALAEKVGKDQAYISRLEAGRVAPQLATLTEIARALDLEIMLVPREKVPAVKAMVQPAARTQDQLFFKSLEQLNNLINPKSPLPAYRLDEDENDG